MRRDPAAITVLITLAVVPSALAVTELSFWIYGSIGVQAFVLVNTTIVATTLAPPFVYAWVRQTAQLRATRAELESLARIDPLTGIANRRAFFEFADAAFARRQPRGRAVLIVDLDDFKAINKDFGQAACDEFLTRAADILRQAVDRASRGDGIVARFDGDAFAALVSYLTSDEVLAMADNIGANVGRLATDLDRGQMVTTACIGIAFCLANTTTEAVLKLADDALNCAKKGGRGRWHSIAQGGTKAISGMRKTSVLVRALARSA